MMFKHANITSKAARIFSVIYGLDWVTTVPPTVKLAFGPPAFAEMVLRLAVIAARVLDGSLTRLRGVPEIAIENVQFRHFLGDPFGFRVGPRLALARIRVLQETKPHNSRSAQNAVHDPVLLASR
jgi:hypothetical protein